MSRTTVSYGPLPRLMTSCFSVIYNTERPGWQKRMFGRIGCASLRVEVYLIKSQTGGKRVLPFYYPFSA